MNLFQTPSRFEDRRHRVRFGVTGPGENHFFPGRGERRGDRDPGGLGTAGVGLVVTDAGARRAGDAEAAFESEHPDPAPLAALQHVESEHLYRPHSRQVGTTGRFESAFG